MFSYNSGQRLPKLSEAYQWWSLEPKGKLVIEFLSTLEKITPSLDDTPIEQLQLPEHGPAEYINPDACPDDRFMDGNNQYLLDFDFTQITDLQNQGESRGLPTDFVGNLCLNRIFTEPWEAADLKHALTGLDYLSNLESTRRTALREAAQRLHITERTWRDALFDNREAASWIYSIHQQEGQIEVYYSTLFVDLRVWTMLKELRAEPFYKPNVIAMLNTLFPPVIKELPSLRISKQVLHKYRNTFYRYVVSVEKKGKSVLDDFIERLNRPDTAHTWSNTRQNLKHYVTLADSMIKQANAVHGIAFFQNRPEDDLFIRSRQNSGATTTSQGSETVSFHSSTNTSYDKSKRFSNKSGSRKETSEKPAEVKSASMKSVTSENTISVQKYVPIPRHKITGRPLYPSPKPTNQGDVEALFQGALPSPWYSSPRRSSSVSGDSSKDIGSLGARLESNGIFRPETPFMEQHQIHPRGSSGTKRTSYDFRPALPGTPELPSPPHDNGKSDGSKAAVRLQITLPSDNAVFLQELHEATAPKAKKSAFSFFRKKKKLVEIPVSESTERIIPAYEASSIRSRDMGKSLDCPRSQNEETLFTGPRLTVKKKSSFSFLQGHKSREDVRAFSDSNSERTITDSLAPPKFNLRTRASLNSLFKDKNAGTTRNGFESSDDREYHELVGKATPRRQFTLRKARSQSSVKSTSSAKSVDGVITTSMSNSSTVFDEDRIITSADISEPFPFGSFVQPQTPAMLFEDTEDHKQIEEIRQKTIEKARQERMARWEQSEEFKRKVEAAREKRKLKREETEKEARGFRTPNPNSRDVKERKKEDDKEREKSKRTPSKPAPNTPSPQGQGSDKPPKTPLKARIIKELASAYSPTM